MRRQRATVGAAQGALFDAGDAMPPQPGALNFDTELRAALNDAIAGTDKTREQIAAEMEKLLGSDPDYPVSRALIDAWTAPSRVGHRFPLAYLPAFIHVTGAHWLLDRLAKKSGRVVITAEQAELVELAQIETEIAELQRRRDEIRAKRGAR